MTALAEYRQEMEDLVERKAEEAGVPLHLLQGQTSREAMEELRVAVHAERIRRKAARARLDLRHLHPADDWDDLLDGVTRLTYSTWEARCRVEDMLEQARYRLGRETQAYVWAALDPEATEVEYEVRVLLAPWRELREALERGWAARR